MRTGKLAISRGHQQSEQPHLSLVPADEPVRPLASSDYLVIHERLNALERLTRLFEQGALSAEEFAAEKRIVLSLPADELVLREAVPVHFVPAAPRRGPSLLGRMLSWRFLLFSLVMGIGFSFAAQPDATIRFFDQTLRALGA